MTPTKATLGSVQLSADLKINTSDRIGRHWEDGPTTLAENDPDSMPYARHQIIYAQHMTDRNTPARYKKLTDIQLGRLLRAAQEGRVSFSASKLSNYWPYDVDVNGKIRSGRFNCGMWYVNESGSRKISLDGVSVERMLRGANGHIPPDSPIAPAYPRTFVSAGALKICDKGYQLALRNEKEEAGRGTLSANSPIKSAPVEIPDNQIIQDNRNNQRDMLVLEQMNRDLLSQVEDLKKQVSEAKQEVGASKKRKIEPLDENEAVNVDAPIVVRLKAKLKRKEAAVETARLEVSEVYQALADEHTKEASEVKIEANAGAGM